jgi:septum formation protein
MGAFFIREIHGSYTNVMGLPLCEVVDVLKGAGVIVFDGGKGGIDRSG